MVRGSRDPAKLAAWKAGAKGEASVGSFEDAAGVRRDRRARGQGQRRGGGGRQSITPHIAGKLVLDTTNPIAEAPPKNGVLQYFTAQNDSLMEQLQKAAPKAHFVKAFNSVGNLLMVNPKLSATPTMFICGNDAGAKTTTTEILTQFGWETARLRRRRSRAPDRVAVHAVVHPGVREERLDARVQDGVASPVATL